MERRTHPESRELQQGKERKQTPIDIRPGTSPQTTHLPHFTYTATSLARVGNRNELFRVGKLWGVSIGRIGRVNSSGASFRPQSRILLHLRDSCFIVQSRSHLPELSPRNSCVLSSFPVLCSGRSTLLCQPRRCSKIRWRRGIAPTNPLTPEDERKGFQLPAGFEMQLVAAEPDIHKPMNIAWDDRGRLWVTDTVEYPYPAAPGAKARDTVKILEDFGPDGRARKITTFADNLNIPLGILPLPSPKPQDALVYSIPAISRLRDSKGTGHADERQVYYQTYGSRDTHGMTNAFNYWVDGWIYACHGFSNTSTIQGKDGAAVIMQSGNIYRFRPDGSHAEQWTHGQVNPFGLTFDPLGNLFSCDCHSQPIYLLLRGGYYPSFGKPDDGLGFGPQTIDRYDDSTAIAGIAFYDADHYPQQYRGDAYIGDVVTCRVNQFKLEWHGSSPRATKADFLKSKDPWFRPVDVKLGPDGALYIADFYNRIIGHYEVPLNHPGRDRERGRIWRVVYRGADGKGEPKSPREDWTTASVGELVEDLGHPNIIVRTKATEQLVERGEPAVTAVKQLFEPSGKKPDTATALRQLHGLWVLKRSNVPMDAILSESAISMDRGVRVHTQHVLAEQATYGERGRTLILDGLRDRDPQVRRAAADALGRHAAPENIRPLLDLREQIPADDTHLLHVTRMSLRDQLLAAGAWEQVAKLNLKNPEAGSIADVSLGVPNADAARYLLGYVKSYTQNADLLSRFVHHIARFGDKPTADGLLAFVRNHQAANLGLQAALFKSLERGQQERGAPLSNDVRQWAASLAGKLLASKQINEIAAGIDMTGALKLTDHQDRLTDLALYRTTPEPTRNAAIKALTALDATKNVGTLGHVLADAEAPVGLREESARLLSGINQPAAREQLVTVLAVAPARLQNVIAAGLGGTKEGAEKLLTAVAAGKASPRLLQERSVDVRLKESRLPDLEKRVADLTKGLPSADQRLNDLLKRRHDGFVKAKPDAKRGAAIFEKSCANCHQIAGKGAKIGPQLDGVGIRGIERLLEDTLDPNRNVDQAFRRTTLSLKSGKVIGGLLLKQEGEVLVLADEQGKEVRVPEKEVDERVVSQMSPMPANFADVIMEADFYDLLAYLLTQRPTK